jgi:hypothetical protein
MEVTGGVSPFLSELIRKIAIKLEYTTNVSKTMLINRIKSRLTGTMMKYNALMINASFNSHVSLENTEIAFMEENDLRL